MAHLLARMSSSVKKGPWIQRWRREQPLWYKHQLCEAASRSLRPRSNSNRRPVLHHAGSVRFLSKERFHSASYDSMTSRAVLCSLRAIRFPRLIFNGRRWRFLDSVAFYSGRPCPSTCHRACNASSRTFPKESSQHEQTNAVTKAFHSSTSAVVIDTEFSVEISTEGEPIRNDTVLLKSLALSIQEDAMEALQRLIFWHQSSQKLYVNKEIVELSLILSDDQHIHHLNKKYLNEDHPTDVLAFPMDGMEDDAMPIMLLGDIVLSLDMAKRQAKEMGHDILTECRILLVHALLHLLGYDHDRSEQSWAEMAEMERLTLAMLGWKGSGLISSAKRLMLNSDIDPPISSSFSQDRDPQVRNGNKIGFPTVQCGPTMHVPKEEDRIQLVAVDLDGTMLTSDQQIRDSSRDAIQEAIRRGIQVVVATGKARPGAIRACQRYGLYGEQNLISHNSAGIFLQGLVVYTVDGDQITGPSISPDVTRSVFQYALETGTSCVAFTGDEAVTLNNTPEILELHERYYEPLAKEMASLEKILEGTPIKKIVLLSDSESIKNEILPHWENRLMRTGSKAVVSVADMLELIPKGVNKWVGLTSLMQSMGINFRSCMAIGDGKNDYEMVKNAAVGVAMGNAVEEVKSVADLIVSSNDEDGIAEAFEKLVL